MSADSKQNVIEVAAAGPFVISGEIRLLDPNEEVVSTETEVALCRCGASENKPYCDGAHEACGFDHVANTLEGKTGTEPNEGDPLNIEPLENGPLFVTGNFNLVSSDGQTVCKGNKVVLCRCSHSENKPFCDGSHKEGGFIAPALSK